MAAKRYGIFVARTWHEPTEAEAEPWRASVLNTTTKEHSYFTSSKALAAFFNPQSLDEETLPHRSR